MLPQPTTNATLPPMFPLIFWSLCAHEIRLCSISQGLAFFVQRRVDSADNQRYGVLNRLLYSARIALQNTLFVIL